MSAAIDIVLGGQRYAVRPLALGQLRRLMAQATKWEPADFPFAALAIALERAEPRPLKPEEVEATPAEATEAARAILEGSGFLPVGEASAAASNGAISTAS
jgi:hypothetical protein